MDNKITKRRLSDFLAYEWILMIIIAVLAIVVWEFVYTVGSVRLTTGQQFKFYYDQTISSSGMGKLYSLMKSDNGNDEDDVFSYDVLSLDSESLTSQYNVLSVRLSVQEGDIVITDCKEPADDAEDKSIRAKTIIDGMYGYSYNQMLKDAKIYLRDNFLKDSLKTTDDYAANPDADLDAATLYQNLDEAKIESRFRARMRKDNRFRSEQQKVEGVKLEKARIEKLCKEVKDFEKLLGFESTRPDLFFKYTKYEQTMNSVEKQEDKDAYQRLVDKEVAEGRGNNIYGLKIENLNKDALGAPFDKKTNPTEYFKYMGADNAKDVVVLAFNFWSYQYDLQFETISFINAIVRDCSTILD